MHIANSIESNPLYIPTKVDKLVTKELCELGIPPDINILEKSIRFSDPVNTFINCAKKQANILIHNIWLLNICDKKSMQPP